MKYLRLVFFSSFFLIGAIFFAVPTKAATTTLYTAEFWNLASAVEKPSMPSTSPDYTTTTASINFNWGDYSPDASIHNNGFVARFTKTTNFEGGIYNFVVRNSDDGIRIYVDDELIFGSWVDQGGWEGSATTTISAGQHTIKIEYYENAGGASISFSYYKGSGTASDPYQISDCQQLQAIPSGATKIYELTSDINCSSVSNFLPIASFYGVLNGYGHTISGVTVSGTSEYQGLFKELYTGSVVINLHLTGGSVRGVNTVGSLAGMAVNNNSGRQVFIGNVSSDVPVYGSTGGSNHGGLVGYVAGDTKISRSSYNGVITGGYGVGGLVGTLYNPAVIENCYTTGVVTGVNDVGGLVGDMEAYNAGLMISNSYAAVTVNNSTGYVGGLVGLVRGGSSLSFSGSIDNSFSASVLSGLYVGGVAGQSLGGLIINNTYFDTIGANTSTAVAAHDEYLTNDSHIFNTSSTPNYLKRGPIEEPLSDWDFDNIWNVVDGDYPNLLPVDSDYYGAPTGSISNLSASSLSNGLGLHITWDPVVSNGNVPFNYFVQIKKSGDTSWNSGSDVFF